MDYSLAKSRKECTKRKNYHHGDLRKTMIKVALSILKNKDIDQLSLREVARLSGVSHTASYRHFVDKTALLAAVAEEGFIEFEQYLKKSVNCAEYNPVRGLQAIGVAHIQYALAHPTQFKLMSDCCFINMIDSTNPQVTEQEIFKILIAIIEEGQETGLFRAGNPKLLAIERWALAHGIAILLINQPFSGRRKTVSTLARNLVTDSLTGLLIPKFCSNP
jgi:AcrR family transcriptional regulator